MKHIISSNNQMGGITAHTVNLQNQNIENTITKKESKVSLFSKIMLSILNFAKLILGWIK